MPVRPKDQNGRQIVSSNGFIAAWAPGAQERGYIETRERGSNPAANQAAVQHQCVVQNRPDLRGSSADACIHGTWVGTVARPDDVFWVSRGEPGLTCVDEGFQAEVIGGASVGGIAGYPHVFTTVTNLRKGRYRFAGIVGNPDERTHGTPSSGERLSIAAIVYVSGVQTIAHTGPLPIRCGEHVFLSLCPYSISDPTRPGIWDNGLRPINTDASQRLRPTTFALHTNDMTIHQRTMDIEIENAFDDFVSNSADHTQLVEWEMQLVSKYNWQQIPSMIWYGKLQGAWIQYQYAFTEYVKEFTQENKNLLLATYGVMTETLHNFFMWYVRQVDNKSNWSASITEQKNRWPFHWIKKAWFADGDIIPINEGSTTTKGGKGRRRGGGGIASSITEDELRIRMAGDFHEVSMWRDWSLKMAQDEIRRFAADMFIGIAMTDGPVGGYFDLHIRKGDF